MSSNNFLLAAAMLVMAAAALPAQTIGSFSTGSAAVTPGGYVSLYAKNVTASGGTIAGVRFYRESNGTSGLQTGSDAYVGMGVYANGMWTFAAPTTGLTGTQTYYAVAYDTAGNASSVASVAASLSGSGFSNWSTLEPFLAKLPLSIGPISSTTVINNGTTIYTGPLDTTITLDRIRGDNGPNRSGDGALFTNNGNPPLPTDRGSVYEFTINPQTGCTTNWTTSQIAFPGPIRFMIDTSGDIYFTGDHYSTDLNLYVAGTPTVGSVAASPSSAMAGTAVTLTASGVSESISPAPSPNADTGSNVLAAVSNVQFFLETNGVSGLQSDTDQLLGCGTQNGSTWTLSNVSTTGLMAGTYTVYAVGVDPAGNIATQTTLLTITSNSSNQPPTVATSAATSLTTNGATLNGTVNPNNQNTTAQFLYGLTTNYNSTAAVVGTLTGNSALAVSANLTGFAPGTTYHFAVMATNASGAVTGLDSTFTTVSIVLSAPTVVTAGAISVVTAATLNATVNPNNQTTTAQFLYGLTTNYAFSVPVSGTLTGNTAQSVSAAITNLSPSTTYHFTITATNNSGSVTGADLAFTTLSTNPVVIVGTNFAGILAGWDVSGLSSYGGSPLAPTTNAPNLAVTGLTRGLGVGTTGTAAARAWGGNTFNSANEAAAITAGQFATFGFMANAGYTVSFTNISKFDYRRSSSGPPNGALQYQVGNGVFTDITNLSYSSSASSGASIAVPIDLSAIAALQNVPAGTNVTFRIVNWGATSSGGTWYVYDVAASTAPDISVSGVINSVNAGVAAPVVIAQPVGTNIFAGKNAGFSVTATGNGTLAFQWLKGLVPVADGGAIAGAQTSSLNFTPATTNNTGNYSVIVTNLGGSVTSAVVTLNVVPLPMLALSNGSGGLVLGADNGAVSNTIIIQQTANLSPPIIWEALQTNLIGANGQIRITLTNQSSPAFFYRIQVP